jgi:hypothetical protein
MLRWRTTARNAEELSSLTACAVWRAWRAWRVWRAWQACVWLAGGRAYRAGVAGFALSVAATVATDCEFYILYSQ